MREIKFRVYSKKLGLIIYNQKNSKYNFNISFDSEGKVFADICEGYYELYYFDPEIMQYTGLKDKNGKEIYEGDLLYHEIEGLKKVYYPFNETSASFGIVEVSNGMSSCLKNSFLYEVIGNVYENPELLKGE